MEDNLKLPSKNIEPLILALSQNNQSFFLKIKKYLDTRTFKNKSYFNDPKYQKIFNIYAALYEKLKGPPKKSTMADIVEKTETDPTVKIYLNSILDAMYNTTPQELDEKYIEDESIAFIKEARAFEAIMKAHTEILNKQYGNLSSIMEDAVQVNFDKDIGSSFKDVRNNVQDMNKAVNEKAVSTGFVSLDKCIDENGPSAKTLNIISAISGGFKSGFLGNLAVNAMLDGKKVVYYTFETSKEKLLGRMYAQAARMNMKQQILNEEELFKRVEAIKNNGDIQILERGARQFSCDDIVAHLKDLKMYQNFVPDLIVVDYLMIMLANSRKQPNEEGSFEYYKNVAEELRNIAKDFDCPVWTAVQLNRGAYSENGGSKGKILASDTAASIGIVNTADFFAAFSQSERDKEDGKIYLGVVKSRNEGNGTKILFDVDYEHFTMREKGIVKTGSNKNVVVNA